MLASLRNVRYTERALYVPALDEHAVHLAVTACEVEDIELRLAKLDHVASP